MGCVSKQVRVMKYRSGLSVGLFNMAACPVLSQELGCLGSVGLVLESIVFGSKQQRKLKQRQQKICSLHVVINQPKTYMVWIYVTDNITALLILASTGELSLSSSL